MNRIAYVLSAGLVVAIGIGGGAQAHAQSLYNYSYSGSHCSVNGYGFCGVSDGYGSGSGDAQTGIHYVNGQLYDGNGVFIYTGIQGVDTNSYNAAVPTGVSYGSNNGYRPSGSTDPLDPHYYFNGRWYDANGTLDYTGIDQYSGYNYEQSNGYPFVYGNANYTNNYGIGGYGNTYGTYGWNGNYGG